MKPYGYGLLIILLIIALLFVIGIFGPRYLKKIIVYDKDLTATITVATEKLGFTLEDDRQSAWNLPAGEYLLATEQHEDLGCLPRTDVSTGVEFVIGYRCVVQSRAWLEIDGAADVTVTLTPAGKLSVTVEPVRTRQLIAKIEPADGLEALVVEGGFGFESDLPETLPKFVQKYQMRLPLIAKSAIVGSHQYYVDSIEQRPEDFWQPVLLSGNVSIIAQNVPNTEKYDVLSEALGTGDVLGIGIDEDEANAELIWGTVTIGQQIAILGGVSEVDQFVIQAVLHTTHRELYVRRFGTGEEGHSIRASDWTIISRWPNGQKGWVTIMTVLFFVTTIFTIREAIKNNPLGKKKKKKKK